MSKSFDTSKVVTRKEMPKEFCWDLEIMFKTCKDWESEFVKIEHEVPKIESFKGTLAQSVNHLHEYLVFSNELDRKIQHLGNYAFLKQAEDGGDSTNVGMVAKVMNLISQFKVKSSYFEPELLSIPDKKINEYINHELLSEYRIFLSKILRRKPHTLSEAEERIIAMTSESSQTAEKSYMSFTNVDMDFGKIKTDKGTVQLTQSSINSMLLNPDRKIRKKAYTQFLKEFSKNQHLLAALYNGSVQNDIFYSKVRNFKSSRESSLFDDNVPVSVYDNLITAVHNNLDYLHKYYRLRKKVLKLSDIRLYDMRVPLVKEVKVHHTYEEAVDVICQALQPLGGDYINTLKHGFLKGWVDRYETKGKTSGAFSSGSYNSYPYILMNYKNDVLNDVFTLAHEGGHSMHSYYSAKNNPYQHHGYSIFAAEVASTFNEELLGHWFLKNSKDKNLKAFLITKSIDGIIGTIYRQTMFAEFEKRSHEIVESNQPLTLDVILDEYKKLLSLYFGKGVKLEPESPFESLRIPHFYWAFYVYKYATGLSASIALSQRVLNGGSSELKDYLNFLKSGGSKFPLDQLREAGVDMETPHPVNNALKHFGSLVDQLEKLIG